MRTSKLLVKHINQLIKENKPDWVIKLKQSSGITDYFIDEEKKFGFTISTAFERGGCFQLAISMYVENEDLFKAIRATRLITPSYGPPLEDRSPTIFFLTTNNLYPTEKGEEYWLSNTTDVEAFGKIVLADIEHYFMPIAKSFTLDYANALSFFDNPNFLLGLHYPFMTGVILALKLNNEKWIYEVLLPLTEKYKASEESDRMERFAVDFRSFDNPVKQIVEPIKAYFAK